MATSFASRKRREAAQSEDQKRAKVAKDRVVRKRRRAAEKVDKLLTALGLDITSDHPFFESFLSEESAR